MEQSDEIGSGCGGGCEPKCELVLSLELSVCKHCLDDVDVDDEDNEDDTGAFGPFMVGTGSAYDGLTGSEDRGKQFDPVAAEFNPLIKLGSSREFG